MRPAGLAILLLLTAATASAKGEFPISVPGQPPPPVAVRILPPPPAPLWSMEYLIQGVDARVIAMVLSAFLGFLGGTLIKFRLDRRRDHLLHKEEVKILAAELLAELDSHRDSLEYLRDYCSSLKQVAATDQKFIMTEAGWNLLQVPGSSVYQGNIGRLGILPAEVATKLVKHHTQMEMLPRIVAYFVSEYKSYPEKAMALLANSEQRFAMAIQRVDDLLPLLRKTAES